MTFADDKISLTLMFCLAFHEDRTHCGKGRKCWLPAFSLLSDKVFNKLMWTQLMGLLCAYLHVCMAHECTSILCEYHSFGKTNIFKASVIKQF